MLCLQKVPVPFPVVGLGKTLSESRSTAFNPNWAKQDQPSDLLEGALGLIYSGRF